jgi:hypothetical protein
MRTIEIAIAEKACLLREALSAVVSMLQYRVRINASSVRDLSKQLENPGASVDVCIKNVYCPDFRKSIRILKERYPQIMVIGYSPDNGNIDAEDMRSLVDHYLYSHDTIATLNCAIVKSCLCYY